MLFYHALLMMNFLDSNEFNLPYFLLCSLRKMAANIQIKIQFIENSLYHHGLVKILIEAHLKRKGDNWEDFMIRNHFNKVEKYEPSSKKMKRRRKLPSNPKKNSPTQGTQQNEYLDDEITLANVLENLKQKKY